MCEGDHLVLSNNIDQILPKGGQGGDMVLVVLSKTVPDVGLIVLDITGHVRVPRYGSMNRGADT